MKTIILIAWISLGHGLSFVAEFSSKENCEIAGKALMREWQARPTSLTNRYICVEK